MNNLKELLAVYDSRKSFYHKAYVKEGKDIVTLYSYMTPIMHIKNGGKPKFVCSEACLSMTTMRHVREFLRQNGYISIADKTKAQIVSALR